MFRRLACVTLGVVMLTAKVAFAEEGNKKLADVENKCEQEIDFIQTATGLKYCDMRKGTGPVAVKNDSVHVHYVGSLNNFETVKSNPAPVQFDNSYERNDPIVFPVGTKRVIAGWDEALLLKMPIGTKRRIIIPPQLGYGSRGAGGVIPPNATLFFTMELVDIGVTGKKK